MEIAHTRPRMIPASYVREGDEIATFKGTGLLAGSEKGVRDADWRDEIEWLTVIGYDSEAPGITISGQDVILSAPDKHVVVREIVSFDA